MKKSFSYTIISFTQSHSGPFGDIDEFLQNIPGSYKSQRPINITGIDEIHLKIDYINGSFVNGVSELILFSLALDKSPGHNLYKEPRIKRFKRIKESVLSHVTFYLEDDDHKPVDFNGKTICVTFQLIQI